MTSSNGAVTITGLPSDANAKLFDVNNAIVFSCDPWGSNVCTNFEVVPNLTVGATYNLSIQNSDICNDAWIPIVIQGGGNSTSAVQNEFAITNLFPNPTANEAVLKVESSFYGEFLLEIYDIIGTRKISKTIDLEKGKNTFELDTDQLYKGTYIVILRNEHNEMKQTRFVKM